MQEVERTHRSVWPRGHQKWPKKRHGAEKLHNSTQLNSTSNYGRRW